jgi:enoyl-CoA hydratase/carnithine racemase
MIPAGGATQTLGRVVGTSAALHAVLTGARIPAVAALERGFVDEVVPRGRLAERTDTIVQALAARPPAAVRAAKSLVWGALDGSLAAGLARETDAAAALRA